MSFFLPDDVVVEQLQATMSELRGKKLELPPPGGDVFLYFSRESLVKAPLTSGEESS